VASRPSLDRGKGRDEVCEMLASGPGHLLTLWDDRDDEIKDD